MDLNHENTAQRIERKLREAFAPIVLEVFDESTKHAGHAGARPRGETHFRVKIVSSSFAGLSRIASHRAVYEALQTDMVEGGIHALALDVAAP